MVPEKICIYNLYIYTYISDFQCRAGVQNRTEEVEYSWSCSKPCPSFCGFHTKACQHAKSHKVHSENTVYVILLPTFVYIPDLGYLQSHTFRQKHAKQVCITQLFLTLFPTFIGAKAFKHVHDLHRPNLLVILDSNLPNITICHRWLVFTWVTAWKSANSLLCHRNQDGHQSGDLHTFYFIPQTNQVLIK